MLHDAVEDGDAAAYGEQQHRQQCADGPDTPCPPSPWLAGLGPYLFSSVCVWDIVQCNGNVSGRRRRRLWSAGGPGFGCDEGQAREEQHNADRVQRLVKGKRVVDGGWGAQVRRC